VHAQVFYKKRGNLANPIALLPLHGLMTLKWNYLRVSSGRRFVLDLIGIQFGLQGFLQTV
jgi:hypothetical protein